MKLACAQEINKLLEPIRKHFASDKRAKKLAEQASADKRERFLLIIEPADAVWQTDEFNETAATVITRDSQFREFVIFQQDNLLLTTNVNGTDTPTFGGAAGNGVNYRTEPFAYRYFDNKKASNPNTQLPNTFDATANNLVYADPETPIFAAAKGTPLRLRLLKPGGTGNPGTFILDGHIWQEEPYIDGSTKLGYNEDSQWLGSRPQLAALNNFDLLIESAGGQFAKPGDYRYYPWFNAPFQGGNWGLVRVTI